MTKLIIIFLILGLTYSCKEEESDSIVIKNLNADIQSEIPIEIELNNLETNNIQYIAKLRSDPDINFLLQKSLPLFSSNIVNSSSVYSAILPKSIVEGEYTLITSDTKSDFTFVEDDDGKLNLFENGKPVLTYNFGMQLPKGVPERYVRSSYIHPIYDLSGTIVTDDFPADHYHHRGLSWMWPKVFIDSVRYDLWHIYGQSGELGGIHQVIEKWLIKDIGPVSANMAVKNTWQMDDGKKVMDESVFLRVFRSSDSSRTIDIKLVWKANTHIVLEGQTKKGYGGLNFRFAPRKDTQIRSIYGKEEDSDLKKLPWADQSARFRENKNFSGVSIFQHKNNDDFPAGWCLRHYGFLGVAWPGIEQYKLESGESISLSFRIYIHNGDGKTARVEDQYKIFESPPIIKFLD